MFYILEAQNKTYITHYAGQAQSDLPSIFQVFDTHWMNLHWTEKSPPFQTLIKSIKWEFAFLEVIKDVSQWGSKLYLVAISDNPVGPTLSLTPALSLTYFEYRAQSGEREFIQYSELYYKLRSPNITWTFVGYELYTYV